MKKNLFLFLFFINLYHFSNQKENETDFNIDCKIKKCKLENTQCKTIGEKQICNCYKCYTYNKEQDLYCGYAQKRQSTAFILEIIPGFGAGYFYLGFTVAGFIKCTIFLFGMFLIWLFPIIAKWCITDINSDCCFICISLYFSITAYMIVIWYLHDLICFGQNLYYDSSNYTLCSWNGPS